MKKLTLSRETVKFLTDDQLARAAGGTVSGTPYIGPDTSKCTGSQCICTATCDSICVCGGSGGPTSPCDMIC